jgi:aryl-alcohol dehydrogenase-like predicted oxidoreductase
MQYRRLGTSNLKISAICLGTMMFGKHTPFDDAASIVASAREHGINFIDTADVYNRGQSEKDLGQILHGARDYWVIASKLGNPVSEAINEGHYSRRWLMQETESILARLQTDYLDILYLHRDYHGCNLEEVVHALGDLIRAGKIRSFGLSNFRGWRMAEIVHLCRQLNVPQPVVCQPYYNLLNRMPEVEILPACGHYGLGVVPYSPLARGVLTGKYPPGQPPAEGTRAGSGDKRIMETEFREESLVIAQEIKARCEATGIAPGQFAAAWVLANPLISSVIVGPRTLQHLESVYGALDLKLGLEDEAFIDKLVVPGHASSPGYNDPAYPFFGRPVAAE